MELANLPTKYAKNQKFQGLGNVRNREDRAKYLLDLNLNGPHYDPKSRSMKGEDALNMNNLDLVDERNELEEQNNFAT